MPTRIDELKRTIQRALDSPDQLLEADAYFADPTTLNAKCPHCGDRGLPSMLCPACGRWDARSDFDIADEAEAD